jgi:hypothetical protein
LSAGNFSSAQTFSAMSNSPSARYVPKRMFRLCSQNKYLSSAAAETALTLQNHRPVESAGRSFSIATKLGCRNPGFPRLTSKANIIDL